MRRDEWKSDATGKDALKPDTATKVALKTDAQSSDEHRTGAAEHPEGSKQGKEPAKKLIRLSRHVWYYPREDALDRPALGYILGERFSLAYDAGFSQEHVEGFYAALLREGLPLPELTALSHWHWDHTLAMPYVHGLTIAERRTDRLIAGLRDEILRDRGEALRREVEYVALEYAGGREMCARTADLVFDERLELSPGGVHVQLLHGPSPHTDDALYLLVEEDKVLLIGDARGGNYPTWEHDPAKDHEMIAFLESLPAETILGSHWDVTDRAGLIAILREKAGD